MDWAPDGSLFVGQTKHTWAGGEGIQQVSWNGKIPFEIQDMKLQEKGFKFTFTKPVDREIAAKKETWPFSRYFYEYREAYGSPRSDETNVGISAIHISKDAKIVEIELQELKAWHIHEVTIQKLSSSDGEELNNNYIVYTLNRLLKNTPPDPLQIKVTVKDSKGKKS